MIDPISATAVSGPAFKPPAPAALGQAVTSFAADLAQAEAVSAQGLAGQAGPREVADAVMSAERSLNAAIAVRDKIVSSFLEVSRMAI